MIANCPTCGAGLAPAQRFCLGCGARLPGAGPDELLGRPTAPRPPEAALRRWPSPTSASATVAATLAAGILMGVGLGPALDGSASATRVLVSAPRPVDPPGEGSLTDPPGDLSGSLGAPVGNVEAPLLEQAPAPAPAPAPVPASEPESEEPAPEPAPLDPVVEDEPPDEQADGAIAVRGTVVQVSEFARSYTVATRRGELLPVHTGELPKLGDALEGEAEPLANGTFGESDRARTGSAIAAALRGMVTWASEEGDLYSLSARGTSILIARAPEAEPAEPGSFVKVRVAIEEPPAEEEVAEGVPPPPRLREQTMVVETEPVADIPLEVATVVQRVDVETREVVVAVDSADEAKRDWALVADEDLDMKALRTEQALIATVTPREDGPGLLTGWADDTGRRAANDSTRSEGDQAP